MRPPLLLVGVLAAAAALAASPTSGFIHPRAPTPPAPHARPRASASSAATNPTAPEDIDANAPAPTVFQRWFRGRFDNAGQVAEERVRGMGPGEGGGHEQIHCVLEPLPALRPGSLGGGERFLGGWVDGWVGRVGDVWPT